MNNPFAAWGRETLQQIDTDFWLPRRNLYAVSVGTTSANDEKRRPASAWDCGVLLEAFAGAVASDARAYQPGFNRLLQSMESYRVQKNGTDAYDVFPRQNNPSRFYDDNEWIVLALCEAYQATRTTTYRARAEEVFRFVQSGENKQLGGGVFWNEPERKEKNTCSNGPGAFGALRLYQITGRREYLSFALRVYEWTNRNLQDSDGLFWDGLALNGKIGKMKWSYNTALMLRTNCLLYAITHDTRYRKEGERVAEAARRYWIRPDTGAFGDEGNFAYSLAEAFVDVAALTGDKSWRDTTARAMTFVHDRVRDKNGHYGKRWDTPADPAKPATEATLLSQASVARGYFLLAG